MHQKSHQENFAKKSYSCKWLSSSSIINVLLKHFSFSSVFDLKSVFFKCFCKRERSIYHQNRVSFLRKYLLIVSLLFIIIIYFQSNSTCWNKAVKTLLGITFLHKWNVSCGVYIIFIISKSNLQLKVIYVKLSLFLTIIYLYQICIVEAFSIYCIQP